MTVEVNWKSVSMDQSIGWSNGIKNKQVGAMKNCNDEMKNKQEK